MEFKETLETIRSESASVAQLFAGDGQRSPTRRGQDDTPYTARIHEAAAFLADVLEGRRGSWQLREAMSTSDFPILFGDILDRQVLGEYREIIPTWEAIARRRVVRDFRGQKLYKPLTGLGGRLEQVGELTEYPQGALEEQATQTLTVTKWGKRVGISWETLINDDLDQFTSIPRRLAQMARRTESYMATELYVGASGPNGTLYSAPNANIVTGNPVLSITGLATALQVFGDQRDENGNPIEHELVTLVIPPALEVIANNIMNATALELTTDGGTPNVADTTATPSATGERRLLAANWLSRRFRIIVNPLIPLVATSNANTSWFLFGSPGSDREALVMAFLRGWEEPTVFIKSSNAQRVGGGGDIDPTDGDFDTDGVSYKIRHVIGTAIVDPKATVASNGTGS